MERRFGIVEVDRNMLFDGPEEIAKAFSLLGIVVLRAEWIMTCDQTEYQVWSPFLPIVPPGQIPPRYRIIIGCDHDFCGQRVVRWARFSP